MRKQWIIVALLAVMVLAACGKSPAAPTAAPTTASTQAAAPAEQCTAFSVFPEPKDPAAVKLPAISANDWSRGSENAVITIIDYSDFQ